MAAGDSTNPTNAPPGQHPCLSASELELRVGEEIGRAARHGTALSCLLVRVEDARAPARGEQLTERTLIYLAGALSRQLRRFDRVGRAGSEELVVVLPGADERRGEIVARRALGRLHSIKLEIDGQRRPLPISVGIAGWREGTTAEQLLLQARVAAHLGRENALPANRHPGAAADAPGPLRQAPSDRRS